MKNNGSSEKALLDNRAKSVRQKNKKQTVDFKTKIYQMRDLSSKLLTLQEQFDIKKKKKYPRIYKCGRFHHMMKESTVFVAKGKESGQPFYSNLVTCGSVWRCPVCSFKITKTRQLELFNLLKFYQEQEYVMSFMTLTMRHFKKTSLNYLINTLLDEFRKLQRVRAYTPFRNSYIGMVKSVEITYSESSGWHPHLHVLFVHKKGVTYNEAELHAKSVIKSWCKREKVDAKIKAQDFKEVYTQEGITEYITKWDSSKELSNGAFKKTRKNKNTYRTTPFGMLSDYLDGTFPYDYLQLENLFVTYHYSTKGRTHLIISPKIREKYRELNPNTKDDADVVRDEQIDSLLFSLDYSLWLELMQKQLTPTLLNSYREGGLKQVFAELEANNIEYDVAYDKDLNINLIY